MGLIKTTTKTVTLPVRTAVKSGLWLVTDNQKAKSKKAVANARLSEKQAKKDAQEKIKLIKQREKEKWASKITAKRVAKKPATKKAAPKKKK